MNFGRDKRHFLKRVRFALPRQKIGRQKKTPGAADLHQALSCAKHLFKLNASQDTFGDFNYQELNIGFVTFFTAR